MWRVRCEVPRARHLAFSVQTRDLWRRGPDEVRTIHRGNVKIVAAVQLAGRLQANVRHRTPHVAALPERVDNWERTER